MSAHIAQQLQLFELDNLAIFFEPPVCITVADDYRLRQAS
jgi:hypothetical protein